MQKNKKKYNWLILFAILILAIFIIIIFRQIIVNRNNQEKEEVKKEESPSVAVYCLIDPPQENASTTKDVVEEKTIRQCFHINKDGVILREAMIVSGGPFLVIYGPPRVDERMRVEAGGEAVKAQILNFLITIKTDFEKLKPENFPALLEFSLISRAANDVEILTADNWKIYLDASRDADKQLEILFAAIRQKGKPSEYIDLRIEGKIYYK